MVGQDPRRRSPSTPRARGPQTGAMQPRMRRLFEAALAVRGDLEALALRLGLSDRSLRHLLCLIRGVGAGRAQDLFDPRRCGRPYEVQLRVQLARYTRADITSFEAFLQDDPVVTAAAQVTGRDDYQIIAFHRDAMAADVWARAVGDRTEVARVTLLRTRTRFGHHVPGLLLGARLQKPD